MWVFCVFGPFFAIQYFLSFLVLQSSRCFTLLVFLQSCGCLCSVSRPRGASLDVTVSLNVEMLVLIRVAKTRTIPCYCAVMQYLPSFLY